LDRINKIYRIGERVEAGEIFDGINGIGRKGKGQGEFLIGLIRLRGWGKGLRQEIFWTRGG